MEQSPQDAWFFTREGERLGPVTLSDLRIKAKDAELNPRLDMVWTQGMEAWKPAGEIDGLFEKRAAAVEQESLAPPADPYKPPKQESAAEKMGREQGWPGARRRSYLLMLFVFPLLWHLVMPMGLELIANQLGPKLTETIGLAALFVPTLVWIYFGLMRLVNLGMSRWWFLGNLVPFLNLWVGYRCFACPAGYVYHKKLDGPGVALAILYWLMMVFVVLAVVAVVALLFGLVGDPELQKQIQEILRTTRAHAPRS
jgi:hypothetical protein